MSHRKPFISELDWVGIGWHPGGATAVLIRRILMFQSDNLLLGMEGEVKITDFGFASKIQGGKRYTKYKI